MGKSKKRKKEKQRQQQRRETNHSEEESDSACKDTDKHVKKIHKKFGLSLLRQGVDCGWEGHELAKLAILCQKTINLGKEKFINWLVKSHVISSQLIAGLQDEGFDFGDSSLLLGILYEQSETKQSFLLIYNDALDNGLFSVKDEDLILKLADITNRGQFSREQMLRLLSVSCSHTETLKACGKLLYSFCKDMVESQALYYISEVVKFDFIMELYGLLDDLLDEMGDLRRTVEIPIRDILKVNRLGEIVDSDADEEGNLLDFIVGDDTPERRSPPLKKIKRKVKYHVPEWCNDDNDFDDDEALEGEASDEDGESDGVVYIHDKALSESSESDAYDESTHFAGDDSSAINVSEMKNVHQKNKTISTSFVDLEVSSSSEEDCHVQRSKSSRKRRRVIENSDDSEDSDTD